MLRSALCDYSVSYILVKKTVTVAPATAAAPNNGNKKLIFKNFVLFTNCKSRISNTEVDDADDIDVVMSIYNLVKYSDNYPKASKILRQYCRGEPTLNDYNAITDFNADNATADLFKVKEKQSR